MSDATEATSTSGSGEPEDSQAATDNGTPAPGPASADPSAEATAGAPSDGARTDGAVDGDPGSEADPEAGVGASTYRLLQRRLETAADDLNRRATELNTRRLEAFGAATLELAATERVRTDNNVVPRDIEAVGSQMVMAYNALAGVRGEVRPEDVFSVHHLDVDVDAVVLAPNPEGLSGSALDDDTFRRDFEELHTYFKDARVQQVYRRGEKLLAVFRTGTGLNDVRVLRWSIEADGSLKYLDDRGDRDHRFPPHHDVEWTPTTRTDHVAAHHIAVGERIFVSPLGGTLDIRLADGSADGELLVSERLDEADQSLQDCEIGYSKVGADLVLLRVLPYRERAHRYFVVNLLTRAAVRLDALGAAFRQLPEGQGLIFPEGIYLRTGEVRRFDLDPTDMQLLEVVRSPNGEDVLYVFHQQDDGRSILLPYNVVRQEVTTPIWCHGHCLFEDGRMIVFREEAEPTRVHPVQVWSTPFCSDEWYADQHRTHSPLDRIGNPGLVAGIADALSLTRLVADVEPSTEVYGDLLGSAGRLLDTHHWFADEVVGDLAAPVHDIRMVAESVIDEFERVQEVRASAEAAVSGAESDLDRLLNEIRLQRPDRTEIFIERLGELRHQLGHLHTVAEQREVDPARVASLIERAQTAHDDMAQAAARHLGSEGSFTEFHDRLVVIEGQVAELDSSLTANELMVAVDGVAEAMDVVAGTVSDLVVEDPRVRTSVLEQVSGVLAELNRVRAGVEAKRNTLIESETGAAFSTELGLFGQTLATAMARADSPEACDDALARLLLQLEQLESSAPRTETQLDELAERREQVAEALNGKRQQLLDAQQNRADRLAKAGERTLDRMAERAEGYSSIDEVNGFFAADPMVARVRTLVEQLRELGEPVRADELQSRLGGAKDGALRAIRDRLDLYDGDAVKFGRHRFSVDDRRRELTLVESDGHLEAVLTGTDLRVTLDGEQFADHRDQWDRPLPSETPAIYRSLYLAADLLLEILGGSDVAVRLRELSAGTDPTAGGAAAVDPSLELVRRAVDDRLDEGYDRGVHDLDAAKLLSAMAAKALNADTLLTPPSTRATAQLAWHRRLDAVGRSRWEGRGRAAASLDVGRAAIDGLIAELSDELDLKETGARYLLAELTTGNDVAFARLEASGRRAKDLAKKPELAAALRSLDDDPEGSLTLVHDYVGRVVDQDYLVDEIVTELVTPGLNRRDVAVDLTISVEGLVGQHPTIDAGRLSGRLDEFLAQVEEHRRISLPAHREFAAARRAAVARLRTEFRVDDLEPRVPEGFVRNQLIDRLYLPLIGDNLARQIGTVEDVTGARSGLLMLLSPPGYGKTTLVDYIADRLGMALVKVSGPGLGHEVTSLDPAQAPSATSAREVERINLSFALGTNVMLYLDDIQHTNPEFLQRFISLCDGQRRIEGVIDGEARTFDLRGKRFAVVMAGNPYTESGQRFQIPDMLANRADTYNLGDVVEGNDDLFARSYLENAITSNPVLAPLAGRDRDDLEQFLRTVEGVALDETRLKHSYASAEIAEILAVLKHLSDVQRVVLAVNRQYIASAATDDQYRTEPPFLLQGSYRNMVRMVSKLLPAMTSEEVSGVVDEHYLAESQALTGAAEANLLKLEELRGGLRGDRLARWNDILDTFGRQQRMGGDERDPATRVVAAIEEVARVLGQSAS